MAVCRVEVSDVFFVRVLLGRGVVFFRVVGSAWRLNFFGYDGVGFVYFVRSTVVSGFFRRFIVGGRWDLVVAVCGCYTVR